MWIAAIDPGFGETGLVLCRAEALDDPLEVVHWATYSLMQGDDLNRAVSLGAAVVGALVDWIYEHHILNVAIVIEQPIYNNNPKTLIKQIRLYEEIEGMLWGAVRQNLLAGTSIYVGEVLPTMSKKVATGDGKASKTEMWAALVEQVPVEWREYKKLTREALVDAYAHALAGYKANKELTWRSLHRMNQLDVEPLVEGRIDTQ